METRIIHYNRMKAFSAKWRMSQFRGLALASLTILCLAILAGCGATGQSVRLPPVTSNPTGEVHVGKFVWIDLMTEDVPAASAFYSDLFGWRAATSEANDEYYLFFKGDKPMGGMVATENQNEQAPESLWLLTLSVDDVDRAVALIKKRGGKVLEGPLNADGRGRMALVGDPAGAPLILLRAAGGDPVDTKAATGEWLWTDLFTQNAKNAEDFYAALAGYQAERVEVTKDHQFDVLKRDGRVRAGIVELRWEGLEDNWLPYIKVNDVGRTIEMARQLGGRLILEAKDVAILSDPTGAVFGIQMTQ